MKKFKQTIDRSTGVYYTASRRPLRTKNLRKGGGSNKGEQKSGGIRVLGFV